MRNTFFIWNLCFFCPLMMLTLWMCHTAFRDRLRGQERRVHMSRSVGVIIRSRSVKCINADLFPKTSLCNVYTFSVVFSFFLSSMLSTEVFQFRTLKIITETDIQSDVSICEWNPWVVEFTCCNFLKLSYNASYRFSCITQRQKLTPVPSWEP